MSTISQVMGVLKVWESWGIYPPIYLTGLEATFRRRSIDVDSLVIPPEELAQLEERKIHVLREVRTNTCAPQSRPTTTEIAKPSQLEL